MSKKKSGKRHHVSKPGKSIAKADMGDTAMTVGLGALGAVASDVAFGYADQKGYTAKLPGTTSNAKGAWKAAIGLVAGYAAKDYVPEIALGFMIGSLRQLASPMAQSAVLGTSTTTVTTTTMPTTTTTPPPQLPGATTPTTPTQQTTFTPVSA